MTGDGLTSLGPISVPFPGDGLEGRDRHRPESWCVPSDTGTETGVSLVLLPETLTHNCSGVYQETTEPLRCGFSDG